MFFRWWFASWAITATWAANLWFVVRLLSRELSSASYIDPMGVQMKVVVAVVVLVFVAYAWQTLFGDSDGGEPDRQATEETTTVRTTAAPRPHQAMPGDGNHPMGGVDGKDWGLWQSTGSSTPCEWSIRVTSPDSGATVLDSGQGAPGQPVRVSIQPFGDVSTMTGEIDGQRMVFQTTGCGAWRLMR